MTQQVTDTRVVLMTVPDLTTAEGYGGELGDCSVGCVRIRSAGSDFGVLVGR